MNIALKVINYHTSSIIFEILLPTGEYWGKDESKVAQATKEEYRPSPIFLDHCSTYQAANGRSHIQYCNSDITIIFKSLLLLNLECQLLGGVKSKEENWESQSTIEGLLKIKKLISLILINVLNYYLLIFIFVILIVCGSRTLPNHCRSLIIIFNWFSIQNIICFIILFIFISRLLERWRSAVVFSHTLEH